MTARMNRDTVLREIIQTLVAGWGHKAVSAALGEVGLPTERQQSNRRNNKLEVEVREEEKNAAVKAVIELNVPDNKRKLLIQLAERFDDGSAFPKLKDVRSFLTANHRDPREIKQRSQSFRRMLPVLIEMSEKGLERVIARAHYSGPAELEPISDAIRAAGEDFRGTKQTATVHAAGADLTK